MDILSKISGRVRDMMNETGMSARELAEKANIDQSVIARILQARRMPSANTLVALADAFSCSTDYLLGRRDLPEEQTFLPCPPFSERLPVLLEHFHITKYRLEKQTRLSDETVRRWQKGRYLPTVESLIRLADSLHCSVDFILGREN